MNFERSKREAIKEFGRMKSLENSGDMRKKPVLDIPRQDPNVMEVDKYRETRRCYNCGETGYLTARYFKLRKERSEEVRIVKKAREDFFLGKHQLTCPHKFKNTIT